MSPLSFRAEVAPQTIDDESRTVDLTFTTGAAVDRMDYWTGERYLEVLSLEPGHVRLDRLNAGAPLLDSHSAWSVADQLGAVVPGTAALNKNAGTVRVRFSKRDAVEPVWQDVRDGIIRSVSVGYRVHKFEVLEGQKNKLAVRTAVDWEPFEVSMVPIPADAGAKVRGATDANPCEIVTRAQEPDVPAMPEPSQEVPKKEQNMPNDDRPEPIAPSPAAEPTERDAGIAEERARCNGIMIGCRNASIPQFFADKLIADGVPLVEAQTRILAELGKRKDPRPGVPAPGASTPDVIFGDDPFTPKRAAAENALLHRANPEKFQLSDHGREYRRMSLMDIADEFLRARGVRVNGMSKNERASAALTRAGGMHTTSDFPNLLADVSNKLLRAAYEEAPQTWRPIAQSVSVPDFKSRKMLQVGDSPALLEVLEHGEFTAGTITEAKEEVTLKTYGRMFTITRQALINDDTNAFAEVPRGFGRAARTKESDLAWAQITANPTMGDGAVLFVLATHNNLASVSAVISVDSIGIGRSLMRTQKGIDGVTPLNFNPNYLIVPAAKETVADQFVSANLMAAESGKVNPFAGRLQVISEPRLDAASTTAWYLATNVSQCPVLFYATLDGQEGPIVDQELGFDVDGLKLRCRLDVAFKAADWHGIFKNAGA